MPEGPSIVILKEALKPFEGKKLLALSGNTRLDLHFLESKTLKQVRSWGKHLLICFDEYIIRIHFLLFGSYRINEERDVTPRLRLEFGTGFVNFYACSVKLLEGGPDEWYDWRTDVMADEWDAELAIEKLNGQPQTLACDALLDQDIFAGSGNIIKNEVLFRIRVHPLSRVGAMPAALLGEMVRETRNYSFDFLEWKKAFVLKKHWLAHTKTICPRCNIPFHKEYLGKTKRRTFFCTNCQLLYSREERL